VNGEGSDGILGEDEITGRLYDVQEEEEITRPGNTKDILKDFWSDSPLLVISFVMIAAIAAGLEYGGHSTLASVAVTGLLLPILGYVLQQLDTVAQTIQRKFLYPRKEWTGAYQRIFDSIIEETDAEKIVITVDNLDRCESSTAYDVLVSLKTFLEDDQCIYLIPCDDEALESHLKTINQEDFFREVKSEREFLRKFFQTHLRIPPFQKEDVEKYAHDQNQELSDELGEETIDIIVNAYFENPRRIKHAINRLVTLRSIAREREKEDLLTEGRITGNMPFLAKLSILEEEYPEFYKQLVEDPYLIDDINLYFQNELSDSDKKDRVEEILGAEERAETRLEAFLSSTQRVTTQNIRSFLNLSDQPYSSGLEDFDDVMRYLKTGQQSELLDRIKDRREKGDSFAQYCNAIDDELRTYRTRRRDQPMYAIINSLVTVFENLEKDEQGAIARVVGKYLTRDPGREFVDFLDVHSTFPVIIQMPSYHSKILFERFADRLSSKDGLNQTVLNTFIDHADEIPPSAVSKLSENITGLEDDALTDSLRLLGESDAAQNQLLTDEIIDRSISLVEIDNSDNEYVLTGLYGYFDANAGIEKRSKYVDKLFELREEYSGNQSNQIDQSLSKHLDTLSPELTQETAETVFNEVKQLLKEQNNEDVDLVKSCLRFYNSLPENARTDFRQWISNLFKQWHPNKVREIFEFAVNSEIPVLQTEEEVDAFLSRIPNQINDDSFVIDQVIPRVSTDFDSKVVEKTCSLIRNNNNNQRRIGLRIIKEHSDRLVGEFGSVIDACSH
jgi:hypothetical protein